MDYMGRLRPKGVPFSGWRYIKGRDFTSGSIENYLGITEEPFKIFRTDALNG